MKRRRSVFLVSVAAALGLMTLPVVAQILLSAGSYQQNFDALGGANAGWINNVTLPGWYASKGGGNATNYFAGSGGSTAGGIYSFGVAGVSNHADRALGSLGASSINYAYGLRLSNDTGVAQTGCTISFTGEQWRSGSTANPHALAFSYQSGNRPFTNAHSGTWTAFGALDFISPNLAGSQAALDGNAAANRQIFTSIVLAGVTVLPGQELFLRWLDVDDTGFDHGLAVDDLTLSFRAVTSAPPTANAAFSVLTYNTRGNHVADWTTNSPQVRAIGRQMQYLQPDIITFQEIPLTNTHEMVNFVRAFLPGYQLATNSGTDGFIRSVILSRFPITRSQKWLDGADLAPFGYAAANFTRDLFEAQIAVPHFPQPLHVFTTHLKAGTSSSDDAARRAAEASAISNFFVTAYLTTNALHPYLLTGDLNEDIAIPATGSQQPIQRLTNGTGLRLTTPLNPVSGGAQTFSIHAMLNRRYDYILPSGLLFSNLVNSQVFRTDLLLEPPAPLLANDNVTASDHLPVLITFANPYDQPFRLVSVTRSNSTVTLAWGSVPGQPYRVENSSNLATWTALATNLMATNPAFTYRTNLLDNRRFFRVQREP